jgi:hypothetical protein
MLAQVKTRLKTHRDALREMWAPHAGPRLSQDLRRLGALKRPVTLFVAEGDPGRDILMAGAGRTAARALKTGAVRIEMIANADHTFSQLAPRKELVARLVSHLRRHLPAKSADEAERPGNEGQGVRTSLSTCWESGAE